MTTDLAVLFDRYGRKARLYPAFLAASPVVLAVALLWSTAGLPALWPLVVSLGVLYFLATWVRGRGQDVEARLIQQWNGMPTTHLLRHSEATSRTAFARRRDRLSLATNMELPGEHEECADPAEADQTYVAATRALITKVRARASLFPRVQDENTHYGFRRNLYALKFIGLAIVVASLVSDAVWIVTEGFQIAGLVVVAIHLTIGFAWLVVVKPDWVKQQGYTYAERLFETLEDDRLTSL